MKKKIIIMVVWFVGILALWGTVIYQNHIFNARKHVLEFDELISDEKQLKDRFVSVQILPRGFGTDEMSSWYHTMEGAGEYDGSYIGAIYELTLTNLTDDIISDWSFDLTFPRDLMFAEGWNGDFEMHQFVDTKEQTYVFKNSKFVEDGLTLEHVPNQANLMMPFHKGDYFSYTPSVESVEVPVEGSNLKDEEYKQKIIGFILYTTQMKIDNNIKFKEGHFTYQLQRSLVKEPMFYVVTMISWIWILVLIVLVVLYFQELKHQKEKLMMEKMIRQFEKDDLTSILSRRAFFHYGQEMIKKEGQTLGLAIIDVDHYVVTQHKLGEAICNEYAKYLAKYLKKQFPDGCVGRFSRGKYAVLFACNEQSEIDPDLFIGEKMREQSPMPDQVLKVGFYAPIDASLTIQRCCDRVILALETIKDEYGQNVAYFDESLENQILDKHIIVDHMEEALTKQQFQVYYQPKNDAGTGRIVGAEALVRWIHPEYGFMNPGQFIPIFEEKGFITKMDAYVFEQVCRDLKKWKEAGIALVPVSVNISRRDFYEKDWMKERIAYAEDLGVDPKLLHMEITESLYSEDTDLIKSNLKWLREKGYLVELDDFGSGYSSLGLLGSLSLDILKLDITFVRNMDVSGVVLESVIQMAHKLNLKTIAEGVETEEQFDMIKKMGCDFIQGYYFSKPLVREDFEAYIKK